MFERLLRFLVFITIFLAPLYVIRWQYFHFLPTTLLETLILATIAVWIVSKILRKDFSWPKTSFDKPILLFLLAGIISLFVTPDLRGGLGVFKAYIAEPILFFYLLVDVARNDQISNPKFQTNSKFKCSKFKTVLNLGFWSFDIIWNLVLGTWNLVTYTLILSGLWVSLLGIMQAVFGIGIVIPHEAAAGRAHAVFNTGNALGLYIGPIFALALGALTQKLKTQNSKLKTTTQNSKLFRKVQEFFSSIYFLIFSLCSFLFAIFLSKSTGALVGLAAAFAVFLVFRLFGVVRGFGAMRMIGVIGMIVGVLFFLNISHFTPKVVNPWERPSESTLIPRFCLWEGTKNLLFEHPIFGAGLSGFKEFYSQKYFTCDAEPLEYPHNWVLNFWSEMGILGLLGFLVVLWVYFERVKRVKGVEKVALTAAMVYWLIHGLVDVPYFKNDLALEFWVIIALAEVLRRRQSLFCQNQQ